MVIIFFYHRLGSSAQSELFALVVSEAGKPVFITLNEELKTEISSVPFSVCRI